MLKPIPAARLSAGMFVHDLGLGWMDHPFLRRRFLVRSGAEIAKIHALGVREVVIDTDRGADLLDSPASDAPLAPDGFGASAVATIDETVPATQAAVALAPPSPLRDAAPAASGSPVLEAAALQEQAGIAVARIMADARLGKVPALDDVEPLARGLLDRVTETPGVMVSLLLLKTEDTYTFMHCVAVSVLLMAFGRSLGWTEDECARAGAGGLLHDLGKAHVPDAILNKPGKLTDEEFAIVKRHPVEGYRMLREAGADEPILLDIVRHHHERPDGKGYPERLSAGDLSRFARVGAIVDVYDALTSDRCYRKAMAPRVALRNMLQWADAGQFDPMLARRFVRLLGVYPPGSLVRLASDRLAVVVETNDIDGLRPTVRAFYSIAEGREIEEEVIRLAEPRHAGERIVSQETPQAWALRPEAYLRGDALETA